MTKLEGKAELVDVKGLLEQDEDFVRAAVEALVQAALEAEMTEAIGAAKGERSETRIAYRSGYYSALADHPGRDLGAAGAAGPAGPVLDRAVRTLSALREGVGRRPWRRCMCKGFQPAR